MPAAIQFNLQIVYIFPNAFVVYLKNSNLAQNAITWNKKLFFWSNIQSNVES
jgi:hypothetical protein